MNRTTNKLTNRQVLERYANLESTAPVSTSNFLLMRLVRVLVARGVISIPDALKIFHPEIEKYLPNSILGGEGQKPEGEEESDDGC